MAYTLARLMFFVYGVWGSWVWKRHDYLWKCWRM